MTQVKRPVDVLLSLLLKDIRTTGCISVEVSNNAPIYLLATKRRKMGNTPSTSETAKKLVRDRALTLPLGSKVEQLFYEDFDSTSDTAESSRKATAVSKRKQSRLSTPQPLDKWAPISTASTGFSDPAHLSKQQARQLAHPLHNIPDKPLPAGPPVGPGTDFFLSPLDALSRSSSGRGEETSTSEASTSSKKHDSGTATVDPTTAAEPTEAVEAPPKVSNETIPSSSTSTTYSAAEGSRWQERISRRIADRKVSDGVKAGLERTAYMGTTKLAGGEKGAISEEERGGG
ncbi:hypothetical protein M409DRAFT_55059 [Zasmidium cellare ATCC 36951]|uniref:Uncharacterized protein n=1 Tax=Zasmidium cellare ATCC 36951 TaxID=1080233 RepID=A0A6A6CGK5_ZASCE|nr:uncharacterized protein M409DRAFT_55059 [Zasmidium cellare ATCC 36951]KAF2166191.1 hypothetical protein M409DRAFT_55059 [Zasmidium cellare ATCC 36951]